MYYLMRGVRRAGPMDEGKFQSMLDAGKLLPSDLVLRDGDAHWRTLEDFVPLASSRMERPPFSPPPRDGQAKSARNKPRPSQVTTFSESPTGIGQYIKFHWQGRLGLGVSCIPLIIAFLFLMVQGAMTLASQPSDFETFQRVAMEIEGSEYQAQTSHPEEAVVGPAILSFLVLVLSVWGVVGLYSCSKRLVWAPGYPIFFKAFAWIARILSGSILLVWLVTLILIPIVLIVSLTQTSF